MTGQVERGGVVGDQAQVHAQLAAKQGVLNRLLGVLGLAVDGSGHRTRWQSQNIGLRQGLVVLFDKGGTDVVTLGVQPAVGEAVQIGAHQQAEFVVERQLVVVAVLEAAKAGDQGAGVVGPGKSPAQVGIEHVFAALKVDR